MSEQFVSEAPPRQTYRAFDVAAIRDIFSYHAPTEEQRETYERINAAFIQLALEVEPLMPDGPGKTAAMRSLSSARMACNASIALEGRF